MKRYHFILKGHLGEVPVYKLQGHKAPRDDSSGYFDADDVAMKISELQDTNNRQYSDLKRVERERDALLARLLGGT